MRYREINRHVYSCVLSSVGVGSYVEVDAYSLASMPDVAALAHASYSKTPRQMTLAAIHFSTLSEQ
jgi:hypothetical protein